MTDTFDEAGTARRDPGKVEELWPRCICQGCPTYNACATDAGELLYCLTGKSFHCITEDLGCVCPSCPLVDELGLDNLTFCILGAEADQRYDRRLLPAGEPVLPP